MINPFLLLLALSGVFSFAFAFGYMMGLLVPKKIPEEKGKETDGRS